MLSHICQDEYKFDITIIRNNHNHPKQEGKPSVAFIQCIMWTKRMRRELNGEKSNRMFRYRICRIQAKTLPIVEMCDDFAGSITLETALVLPIFMLVVISLLSSIEVIREYSIINEALYQVGKEVAFYSYPYEELKAIGQNEYVDAYEEIESFTLTETYVRSRLISIIGTEWLDKSMVKDGALGLHLYRSDIGGVNNDVDLVLTYKIKPWFSSFGLGEFYLINRCRMKAWLGYKAYDEDELANDEEYVYVAENGKVYHLYEDCTHLCLSIQTIGISQINDMRNEGGARYKPCENCLWSKTQPEELVYVTDWGDRYHSDITCSGLKRTISKVRISEVAGKGLCARCGSRQE